MEGTYRMGGKSKREEEGRRVREGKGGERGKIHTGTFSSTSSPDQKQLWAILILWLI